MALLVVIVCWAAIGIATGLLEARRGHWSKTWILGAVLGPLAVPFALEARRREPTVPQRVLLRGEVGGGDLEVLVGVDGSETSSAAAVSAAALFGPRLGRMTLAAVLDYDTAEPHTDLEFHPEPWDEERAADEALEAVAATVEEAVGLQPAAVVLPGRPAEALQEYALTHGFDVLVVGCRGRGVSKALLGSCASQLSHHTRVPVLLAPQPASLDG